MWVELPVTATAPRLPCCAQITVDKPLGLTLADRKGGEGGVVVQARPKLHARATNLHGSCGHLRPHSGAASAFPAPFESGAQRPSSGIRCAVTVVADHTLGPRRGIWPRRHGALPSLRSARAPIVLYAFLPIYLRFAAQFVIPGSNAAKAGIKAGDTVLYTSSFFGDELWCDFSPCLLSFPPQRDVVRRR